MTNDFETMPIGTTALLARLAVDLRVQHQRIADVHKAAEERARSSHGWRNDADVEERDQAFADANRVAEQIGAIEALLDRCPHAPPLEPGLFHCKAKGIRVISVERG